eukprot:TRINITY_DN1263_c0_g1_i1.p1 TRINITY_DN1263_c0_g1~~TRINITY_DN1263_c0_g1_i1.p1  ORF type:complete len:1702 (-),score=371.79 TRINITY_DN1263_c0_g1_i1:54-5138(-)
MTDFRVLLVILWPFTMATTAIAQAITSVCSNVTRFRLALFGLFVVILVYDQWMESKNQFARNAYRVETTQQYTTYWDQLTCSQTILGMIINGIQPWFHACKALAHIITKTGYGGWPSTGAAQYTWSNLFDKVDAGICDPSSQQGEDCVFCQPQPVIVAVYWLWGLIILYWLVGSYVSQAFPGESGRKKEAWWFPFQWSYWFGGRSVALVGGMKELALESQNKQSIIFDKVSMTFKTTSALKELSLKLDSGQVICWLGPSGAGKTTSINILSGNMEPSFGNVFVFGEHISEFSNLRNRVGVCPQHNCLFDNMTPVQHLKFWIQFRGLKFGSKPIKKVIQEALEMMDLWDFRDRPVKTFSGGMKRRMCVAVALLGDPDIIFLDEPTSGVDPLNRSKMWSSILKLRRSGRIVILTSHEIEECERVADQVVILSDGYLRAFGTPETLKQRFSNGQRLSLLLPEDVVNDKKFFSNLDENIPGLVMLQRSERTLMCVVPSSSLVHIPLTMAALQDQELIQDWSLSSANLEDVFLSLIKSDNQNSELSENAISNGNKCVVCGFRVCEKVELFGENGFSIESDKLICAHCDSQKPNNAPSSSDFIPFDIDGLKELNKNQPREDNGTNIEVEKHNLSGVASKPEEDLFKDFSIPRHDNSLHIWYRHCKVLLQKHLLLHLCHKKVWLARLLVLIILSGIVVAASGVNQFNVKDRWRLNKYWHTAALQCVHPDEGYYVEYTANDIVPYGSTPAPLKLSFCHDPIKFAPFYDYAPIQYSVSFTPLSTYKVYSPHHRYRTHVRVPINHWSRTHNPFRSINFNMWKSSHQIHNEATKSSMWYRKPMIKSEKPIEHLDWKLQFHDPNPTDHVSLLEVPINMTTNNFFLESQRKFEKESVFIPANECGRSISSSMPMFSDALTGYKEFHKKFPDTAMIFDELDFGKNGSLKVKGSWFFYPRDPYHVNDASQSVIRSANFAFYNNDVSTRVFPTKNCSMSLYETTSDTSDIKLSDMASFMGNTIIRNLIDWDNSKGYNSEENILETQRNGSQTNQTGENNQSWHYEYDCPKYPMILSASRRMLPSKITPYPKPFDLLIVECIAVLISLALFPSLVAEIIQERRGNLFSLMKLQGLRTSSFWVSIYVNSFVSVAMVQVIWLFIGMIFGIGVFSNSGWIYYLLLAISSSHACVGLILVISALLVRSTLSTFFCYMYITISAATCPSVVNIVQTFDHILLYWPSMAQTKGISILNEMDTETSKSMFMEVNRCLLISGTILVVLGWYLHQIISPPETTDSKHPLFFLDWLFDIMKSIVKVLSGLIKKCFKSQKWNSQFVEALLHEQQNEDYSHSNDVYLEHLRALENGEVGLPVRILNLKKIFKVGRFASQTAVDNLSLTVQSKECLGLLGPNGSGKTTTLRMLSGHETITSGDAWICDAHVKKQRQKAAEVLGICPQYDGLWPELTSLQHLEIFAKIKGVPTKVRQAWCTHILELMDLDGNAKNMKASMLSGGMARRLSLGVAMVGKPQVLLLDEPTAGLDPGSRRKVWKCIERIKKSSQLILTTHSMFEADSLCSRIAIIVKGKLQCVGNQMELKRRIGDGWQLHVTFSSDSEINIFTECLKKMFPNSMIMKSKSKSNARDRDLNLSNAAPSTQNVVFALSSDSQVKDMALTELFGMLQLMSTKRKFNIQEWTISQSSLEEVFINVVQDSTTD